MKSSDHFNTRPAANWSERSTTPRVSHVNEAAVKALVAEAVELDAAAK